LSYEINKRFKGNEFWLNLESIEEKVVFTGKYYHMILKNIESIYLKVEFQQKEIRTKM